MTKTSAHGEQQLIIKDFSEVFHAINKEEFSQKKKTIKFEINCC